MAAFTLDEFQAALEELKEQELPKGKDGHELHLALSPSLVDYLIRLCQEEQDDILGFQTRISARLERRPE